MSRSARERSRAGTGRDRLRARWETTLFGAIVTATDLLPPRIRYGYVHRLTRWAYQHPLPSLQAGATADRATAHIATRSAATTGIVCLLAADHLDVGGIGSVIEMLASGLAEEGVRPVVVCHGDGTRAARLRARGVEVVAVASAVEATEAIRRVAPDVIQLHSAPLYLEAAAIDSGVPLVTALHNTEIHYTPAKWRSVDRLLSRSVTGIAVSETVRRFHARRLPDVAARLVVVPNGAPAFSAATDEERGAARGALGRTLGVDLSDDVVLVCLARYDAQKNIAGTVASYLRALTRTDGRTRLVFAGDPSDWAELRRADAIRRGSARGDRVHLLGNSDAAQVLRAADAFVLNSFFEGWPVAATEAAAAGLPLLLADVGGASELVARDPARSVMIPNATGEAEAVSDGRVARARRRSLHQANADGFARGLRDVTAAVRRRAGEEEGGATAAGSAGAAPMVRAHADVLRAAAATGSTPPASPRADRHRP